MTFSWNCTVSLCRPYRNAAAFPSPSCLGQWKIRDCGLHHFSNLQNIPTSFHEAEAKDRSGREPWSCVMEWSPISHTHIWYITWTWRAGAGVWGDRIVDSGLFSSQDPWLWVRSTPGEWMQCREWVGLGEFSGTPAALFINVLGLEFSSVLIILRQRSFYSPGILYTLVVGILSSG